MITPDITQHMVAAGRRAMIHNRGTADAPTTYETHVRAVLEAALPLHPAIATDTLHRDHARAARDTIARLTAERDEARADADTWRHRAEYADTALADAAEDKARLGYLRWLETQLRDTAASDRLVRCEDCGGAHGFYRWIADVLRDALDPQPEDYDRRLTHPATHTA